jgi:hypothetical protein
MCGCALDGQSRAGKIAHGVSVAWFGERFEMEVTCLIPAFKVRYFEHLLIGLRTQSLPPKRIVISDDSPGGDFLTASRSDRLQPLVATMPVEIVEGPRQGHHGNIEQLLDIFLKAPTSHFHILNDDDMIYPEFYAHHGAVSEDHDALCSVSRRWVTNDRGVPTGFGRIPEDVLATGRSTVAITPDMILGRFAEYSDNWLGELSCGVFRADFIERPDQFCVYDGMDYNGLNDIGSFIKASLIGTLVFSNQYLGAFRRSRDGLSRQRGYAFGLSILARIPLSLIAFERQLLDLNRLLGIIASIRAHWIGIYDDNGVSARLAGVIALGKGHGYGRLKVDFLDFWCWYRDKGSDLRACATPEELKRRLS